MENVQSTLSSFKEFILRGNVVDLAVAVVVGAAFQDVVSAFVEDLLTPLITAIGGDTTFENLTFQINESVFAYGHLLNTIISFFLVAAVVFFFVVKPTNLLIQRAHDEPPPDPTTRKCPECLSEIPIKATRCAFCTAEVGPAV